MNTKKSITSFGRLCATALLALSCGMALAPVPAYADIESDLAAAQAKLAEMSVATQEAADQLEVVQEELAITGTQISEVQERIVQKQGELVDAKGVLSRIIESSYKDETNLISIILGSASFDELVSNLYYANKVAEDRARAVDAVRTLQEELDAQKGSLEAKKADQERLVTEQTDRVASLTAAQDEQSAYVDSLSAELQAQIEAARRAEEEAAAAAAAAAIEAEQQAAAVAATETDSGEAYEQSASEGERSTGGAQTSLPVGGAISSSSPVKQAAVQAALSQLGKPYSTPTPNMPYEFDCSGLVWWAYQQAGVSIPRSQRSGMYQQVRGSGTWTTNYNNLAVGDLLFYSSNGGASTNHVAMYIGGGQVVHANGSCVAIGGISGSFIGGGSII